MFLWEDNYSRACHLCLAGISVLKYIVSPPFPPGWGAANSLPPNLRLSHTYPFSLKFWFSYVEWYSISGQLIPALGQRNTVVPMSKHWAWRTLLHPCLLLDISFLTTEPHLQCPQPPTTGEWSARVCWKDPCHVLLTGPEFSLNIKLINMCPAPDTWTREESNGIVTDTKPC